LKFPRPINRKQLQCFLGLASYYRKYLPHFANLSANLSDMLGKGVRFVWIESADQSFLDSLAGQTTCFGAASLQ